MEQFGVNCYGKRQMLGLKFPVLFHRFIKVKAAEEGASIVEMFVNILEHGIQAKYGIDIRKQLGTWTEEELSPE